MVHIYQKVLIIRMPLFASGNLVKETGHAICGLLQANLGKHYIYTADRRQLF